MSTPDDSRLKCTCTVNFNSMELREPLNIWSNYQIELCPLHAAAPQLLEALEAVQWITIEQLEHLGPICPLCRRAQDNKGHIDICQLDAAIKAAREGE